MSGSDVERRPATSTGVDSWSRQYELRRSIAGRFGDIFALPVRKRARDVLLAQTSAGDDVLEIGAGDRRMKSLLEQHRPGVRYESMDVDPQGDHEYRDLSMIEKLYDVVFAFEVVEHISLAELREFLPQATSRLKPGGRLILSTPNIYYPPAYLRDVTHQTPLCYDELGALVEACGPRVDGVFRIYNDPVHRILLRRYALGWLFRTIGIDYARQIVLVARTSK